MRSSGSVFPRNVEGAYKKLIDWINRNEDMKTIAVDIPSGISSDTGEVMGDAVRADVTVTFGMKKLGQVLFPGREYCGELLVRDVGFVPESSAEQEKHVQMLDREDLLRIPARTPDSNKGTYGKVLVMAGAKNMAGAACLSARAAYRMGAGLVKIFTPEENRTSSRKNSRRRSFPVTMREKPEKIRRALRERSQGRQNGRT